MGINFQYKLEVIAMEQKFKNTDIKLGDGAEKLTGPQRSVLLMACMGLTEKEIASAIERSPETVKSHIQSLFIIFGVNTRGALIKEALCHGLVVPIESKRRSSPMYSRGPLLKRRTIGHYLRHLFSAVALSISIRRAGV